MQRTLQHLCGQMINVEKFQSHGETILSFENPATGEQIERCPECGEVISEEMLFPLDMFPEVYAEMADSLAEV